MDLGSGPIMKASSGAGDHHGTVHKLHNRPPDSGIGNVMFSFTTEYTHTKLDLKSLEHIMEKGSF